MPNPFVEEMEASLPWLFQELGFRVTSQSYSYRAMGSALVDLDSNVIPLRLRFVRDPLCVYVEVAPLSEPKGFWELSLVLETIRGERPAYGRNLESAASLFRDNMDALTDALGPKWPETKEELERRHQLRLKEMLTPRHEPLRAHLKLPRLRWRRYARLLAILAYVLLVWWIVTR